MTWFVGCYRATFQRLKAYCRVGPRVGLRPNVSEDIDEIRRRVDDSVQ